MIKHTEIYILNCFTIDFNKHISFKAFFLKTTSDCDDLRFSSSSFHNFAHAY